MASEQRVRPVLWVVFGAFAVLIGLPMAYSAGSAVAHIDDVAGTPACPTDFASGCTTQRAGVLTYHGSSAGSWLTGLQKWLIQVPGGAPDLRNGALLKVEVPRQEGRGWWAEGTELTVIYYSRSPAWIRLPSGAVLETNGHPRRYAVTYGWMALAVLGAGAFAIQTGVASGRRGGVWLRRTEGHIAVGPARVLATAGMFGYIGQLIGGGTIWLGIVGGLIGATIGIVTSLR